VARRFAEVYLTVVVAVGLLWVSPGPTLLSLVFMH